MGHLLQQYMTHLCRRVTMWKIKNVGSIHYSPYCEEVVANSNCTTIKLIYMCFFSKKHMSSPEFPSPTPTACSYSWWASKVDALCKTIFSYRKSYCDFENWAMITKMWYFRDAVHGPNFESHWWNTVGNIVDTVCKMQYFDTVRPCDL